MSLSESTDTLEHDPEASDVLAAEHLRQLLELSDPLLNSALDDVHPRDIATAAEELEDEEAWALLRRLEPPHGSDVFAHLPMEMQVRVARMGDPDAVADLLEAMSSDDRVDVVQELPEDVRAAVLARMEAAERADVERLAVHAEGTAGSVMSTDFATLKESMTVQEAVERLRELAAKKETIYYNYVTDAADRLLGIVSLRDLVMEAGGTRLADVMSREVKSVRIDEDVEEVARQIREYDLLALPVVDADDRLAGIITVDDIIDVTERETTEDFARIGAVTAVGADMGTASFGLLYRKRIPWLLVLVFVNIFSGAGIAYYEQTVAAVVALVFFLPLLIASGGNAGSQAATLMVRALATGEVQGRDWLRLLGREVGVAAALGLTMAVAVSLVAFVRVAEEPEIGLTTQQIAIVVCTTMVLIVVVGSLIGMTLPFLFEKVGFDPATASGPLVTSLADICGVLIYFGMATWMLQDVIARAAARGGAG